MKILMKLLLALLLFVMVSCEQTDKETQGSAEPLIEKAQLLYQHGLTQQAKSELINVIFGESAEISKSEAYYLLGSIAFEENRIIAALDVWRELVAKFPNSEQAQVVKGRIDELAEIVGETVNESIDNAIALSYMRHGNFWSKRKSNIFTIDSSWITNVDAAIKWYDKVIAEFPNSSASRLAYEEKMRTLIGWKDSGMYGSSHGIIRSFSNYMPQMLETFEAYETEFSDASNLQAFRYQIAQAYWDNRDWNNTRAWLNLVIEKSGEGDSFYKDLAERRLVKVEY